ncbi:MAG: PilZ domain-containing protein [Aquificota bacterium]|jgi:hypothetical protein
MNFFIGYEADNPVNNFYYIPLSVDVNKVKVQLLENTKVDPNKLYQLYFSLDGVNFNFLAKPIKFLPENKVIFFILDSKIELRKYPRIPVNKDIPVKVWVDALEAKLLDISLGGCRVKILKPIDLNNYTKSGSIRNLYFQFFDRQKEEIYKILAKVVNVDTQKKEMAFVYIPYQDAIGIVYKRVLNLLKGKQ